MLKKLYNNTLVYGITRIRNEEAIIQDTLDYYSQYCDGIYVYDDCSTDQTLEIVKSHLAVKGIIEGKEWDTDRTRAEYITRQAILELAQKDNPEWLIYFDADERIEFPDIDLTNIDGISMKLFDYYITEEDRDKNYNERKWLGPEYRDILMMFRNTPDVKYHLPDQREATLAPNSRIINTGYVKHYGKAISIEEWEKTCEYYSKNFPEPYKTKWENRKGKAIHTKSDFGNELITWEQKEDYGFPL